MDIRGLTGDDVETIKKIRLEALSANPEAFRSDFETEAGFDDATWRERLAGFRGRPGQVFVAEVAGRPVGMAGVGWSENPGETILWGMFVADTARGRGVGRALVDVCVGWAEENGAELVVLEVADANDSAKDLYRRSGFVDVGEADGDPNDPCFGARIMHRSLSG